MAEKYDIVALGEYLVDFSPSGCGKMGNPLYLVNLDGDIDTFTDLVWNNLNEDNKVSLFVRYIDIETGKYESRIINKNK